MDNRASLEALEDYKQEIKLKQYDKMYSNYASQFISYCVANGINALESNYQTFTNYIIYKRDVCKNSNETLNNHIKIIKSFFNFCKEQNKLLDATPYNAICLVKTFKHQRKIYDIITKTELEDLIITSVQRGIYIDAYKLKALLYLMFYTGMRRNEIANLKRCDIDLVQCKGIVRLPNKSKKEREFFFPPRIGEFLKYYFDREKEDFNAFNLNYNQIKHIIDTISKNLVNKKITPHSFKRSFANMLMEEGIDVADAQLLLGHANILTTMVYYKPSKRRVEKNYRDFIK